MINVRRAILRGTQEAARLHRVRDERESLGDSTIGGDVTRAVTARSSGRHSGHLTLQEKRPWMQNGQALSEFTLTFDLNGPEEEGWSQAERRHWLEVA